MLECILKIPIPIRDTIKSSKHHTHIWHFLKVWIRMRNKQHSTTKIHYSKHKIVTYNLCHTTMGHLSWRILSKTIFRSNIFKMRNSKETLVTQELYIMGKTWYQISWVPIHLLKTRMIPTVRAHLKLSTMSTKKPMQSLTWGAKKEFTSPKKSTMLLRKGTTRCIFALTVMMDSIKTAMLKITWESIQVWDLTHAKSVIQLSNSKASWPSTRRPQSTKKEWTYIWKNKFHVLKMKKTKPTCYKRS